MQDVWSLCYMTTLFTLMKILYTSNEIQRYLCADSRIESVVVSFLAFAWTK
jgi:hypothetical protein